jgi:tetratricopeptide (TPR) repeat protein
LAQPPIAQAFGALPKEKAESLRVEIETKCEDNFLYLYHLFREAEATLSRSDGGGLDTFPIPKGLDEIYRFFAVGKIKRAARREDWRAVYLPVLGVLAVIRDPITKHQLAGFARVDVGHVDDLVAEIEPFLNVDQDPEVNRYQLFHTSFAEYLLDPARNRDFRLDAAQFHKCVALYYRQRRSSWMKVAWEGVQDDYPFDHLAHHLAQAGKRGNLFRLIDRPWMQAQFGRALSYRAFARDVALAISVAEAKRPPDLFQVIRGSAIYATLSSISNNIPPTALGVMAVLGKPEMALANAALIGEPLTRVRAYARIALASARRGDQSEARALLEHAVQAAHRVEGFARGDALASILQDAVRAGDHVVATTVAEQVETLVREGAPDRSLIVALVQAGHADRALALLAEREGALDRSLIVALVQAGHADHALALLTAARYDVEAFANLIEALASGGEVEKAVATARSLDLAPQDRTMVLAVLSAALAAKGDMRLATEAAHGAADAAETVNPFWDNKGPMLALAVSALAAVGEHDRLMRLVDAAVQAAESVRNPNRMWVLASTARRLARAGQVDRALKIAGRIRVTGRSHPSRLLVKENALLEMARALARIGDGERAVHLAEEARRLQNARAALRGTLYVMMLPGIDYSREQLEQESPDLIVAQGLLEAKLIDRAVTVGEAALNPIDRDAVFGMVSSAQLRAGELGHALALADRVQAPPARAQALTDVAQAHLDAGNDAEAARIVDRVVSNAVVIDDPWLSSWCLRDVVKGLAELGHADKALIVADALGPGWNKNWMLLSAAGATIRGGDDQRADALIGCVMAAARARSDGTSLPDFRAHSMAYLIRALGQVGRSDRALELADRTIGECEAECEAEPEVDRRSRQFPRTAVLDTTLDMAARALAEVGLLDRALASARAIGNPWERMAALGSLTKAFARAGRDRTTAEIAEMAIDAAEETEVHFPNEIFHPWWKYHDTVTVAYIADAFARAGRAERVTEAVRQLKEEARSRDPGVKASCLARMISLLAGLRDRDGLLKVASMAEATSWISDSDSVFYLEIAEALAQAGETNRAEATAWRIGSPDRRDEAFCRIAHALAQAGETNRALALLNSIADPLTITRALGDMAYKLLNAGRRDAALTIAERFEGAAMAVERPKARARFMRTAVGIWERLEDEARAVSVFLAGCSAARGIGRGGLFEFLSSGIPLIVRLDQGRTLWRVHEAMLKIEGWWSSRAPT